MSFYDWLTGNCGIEGDYSYKKIHIISLIVVLFILFITYLISKSKKISNSKKKKILIGISIFQLSFEIIWRIIYLLFMNVSVSYLWPLYPCNLAGILVPILALSNNNKLKDMFYLFAFIGGVLTFVNPDDIFNKDVLNFPILKSILQHTGILIIPLFEYFNKTYKPEIKNFYLVIMGCIIHVINCEVITRILGYNGDYMFFRSGMPFVINGVPQFLTLSIFGIIVLYLCQLIISKIKIK